MTVDLATIWAGLIAFAVLAYVVLDGFDLGVGILFPVFPEPEERDQAINSIAPVWDGNETWLVLGGGGLMAVFPLAYATIFPALYIPIILMLLGLIFRGVAFEFRFRTRRWKAVWDWGFFLGSGTAALMQGIALGALVQGIEIENRAYSGGWWDWLSPFSVTTGIGLAVGYALLGSTWLNLKTTGAVQVKARRLAILAAIGTVALIGVVSLWTPMLDPIYFERWFGWPTAIFSALVPLLVMSCAILLWWGLRTAAQLLPFLAALGLFVLSFIGIGISFYPYIVPGALTIAEAAAPDESLGFLLIGAAFLVPIILAYTAYAYWVFRGKVEPGEGYH
jgi:cytochrome d ubiquinol oxidase subunit II